MCLCDGVVIVLTKYHHFWKGTFSCIGLTLPSAVGMRLEFKVNAYVFAKSETIMCVCYVLYKIFL